MNIKEFIENFAEQFDDSERSQIKPETVFHELDEYTSLIALSIIAMVDEEYGVTLNTNDMSSAITIMDLFNTVKSKNVMEGYNPFSLTTKRILITDAIGVLDVQLF